MVIGVLIISFAYLYLTSHSSVTQGTGTQGTGSSVSSDNLNLSTVDSVPNIPNVTSITTTTETITGVGGPAGYVPGTGVSVASAALATAIAAGNRINNYIRTQPTKQISNSEYSTLEFKYGMNGNTIIGMGGSEYSLVPLYSDTGIVSITAVRQYDGSSYTDITL